MYTYENFRQCARMIADELKKSVRINDGSRAKSPLENKVELSEDTFPRKFDDGEEIIFHLGDYTEGRFSRRENIFNMTCRIFYKKQDIPIVITLGNTYERSAVREDLKYLSEIWEEPCGDYLFWVEKNLPR